MNITMSAISVISINVAADTQYSKQIYINHECSSSQTCDLESFFVKTKSVASNQEGQTFMSAGFTTTSNEALRKYAIVQFHQGCMYKQKLNGVEFLRRNYMGQAGVPFHHPEMSVDSGHDSDPIYQSSVRGGRDDGFGYIYPRKENYMIQEPNFDGATPQQDTYMNNLENPKVRSLYVSDVPTFADLKLNNISSLNFITCLYKTDDVPQYLNDPRRASMGEAIKCFEWNHNWKLSSSNKLERTVEIDSTCLEGEK